MFSFFKNADRMLLVCEIILNFNQFRIHFMFRILEASTKLRHVEDIMDVTQLRWQLQLISHQSMTGEDAEGTNVARI